MRKECMTLALVAVAAAAMGAGPVSVSVDFTKEVGTIRRLNGGNVGPNLALSDIKGVGDGIAAFRELAVPLTRLHDIPIANPSMRLVDTHQIFGNEAADAQNPENYYFEQTDDYIRTILATGSRVLYRLGTSIEHSLNSYAARPPKDYGKWADICVNIIRHYNEGWANGQRWNIEYWEIWNEPDIKKPMWLGSFEDFCRLYEVASKKIKARFPNVKVGGPAFANFHPGSEKGEKLGRQFLAYCRDHKCPLDFLSWHRYDRALPQIIREPVLMRQLVDEYGFKDAELILNEWHYWVGGFRKSTYSDSLDALAGVNSAVFATAVLTGWQDTPLTMGCFYTIGQLSIWWGAWGRWNEPYRLFHTLKMFANVARHAHRVAVTSGDGNVQVLAGRDDKGERAVLVSNFKSGASEIRLKLEGAAGVTFRTSLTDAQHETLEGEVRADERGEIVLPGVPAAESSAWYLEERRVAP